LGYGSQAVGFISKDGKMFFSVKNREKYQSAGKTTSVIIGGKIANN